MPGARQASGEGGSNDGIVSEIRFKRLSGDAQEVAMATTAAGTDTPQLPALLLLRSEDPPTLIDCISVMKASGCNCQRKRPTDYRLDHNLL